MEVKPTVLTKNHDCIKTHSSEPQGQGESTFRHSIDTPIYE